MKHSIKTAARIAGILFVIIIATGIFNELFVSHKPTDPGDATAIANDMAWPILWRLDIVSTW